MKNITSRTKPKQILHEPEVLREEVFSLSRKLEQKKSLNFELTQKLAILEGDNSKYESIIQVNFAVSPGFDIMLFCSDFE